VTPPALGRQPEYGLLYHGSKSSDFSQSDQESEQKVIEPAQQESLLICDLFGFLSQ
jgi:hypothetical protein